MAKRALERIGSDPHLPVWPINLRLDEGGDEEAHDERAGGQAQGRADAAPSAPPSIGVAAPGAAAKALLSRAASSARGFACR